MNEKTILVVDDEKSIRELFIEIFEDAGFAATTAESAEKALEILKERKIHVMFLDLNLPGMNGVELCKIIRKDFPDAFIYAVTGFSHIFQVPDCLAAGFNNYFVKPVDVGKLVDAAKDAFKKLDAR